MLSIPRGVVSIAALVAMDVDSLSATDVPDTQTTVSSRDPDEQENVTRESVTEPEEFAQYKWRQGAFPSHSPFVTALIGLQSLKMIFEIWQPREP